MELRISDDLSLPAEVAGEAIAILAKRGAGKTNTAVVLVEEMLDSDVQVVVLDPVGVWYGLRGDGTGKGFSVAVLGGEHGDVPLEQAAGGLIADVVVDSGQSLVIDLSDFPTKAAQTRFVTEFLDRLYRRKARSRSTLHVVLEEADEFAPQRVGAAEARMVGAVEQMVKRGRSRGLGMTMIAQRSASLNKNVLDQADTLVVMRTTGPRDRKAVEGWIEKQDAEGADDVLPSLPGLGTGEAWVWNPERGMLARVMVRSRRTFDSSATPKAGEVRPEPRAVAAIDLDALGMQIQATAERARENDPKVLRQKVALLERELSKRDVGGPEIRVETVTVEVPVLKPGNTLETVLLPTFRSLPEQLERAISEIKKLQVMVAGVVTERRGGGVEGSAGQSAGYQETVAIGEPGKEVGLTPRRSVTTPVNGDVQIKAGARRILETLARHHPLRVTKSQLGTLAKFKITGGTFQTYWGVLRRAGYVEERDGLILITDAGREYVGHVQVEPLSTAELLEMWRGSLKAGARRMLDILVETNPDSLSRDELALRLDMEVTGGTFQTYLGTLRRNGLAEIVDGQVRAGEALFLGVT